MSTHQIKLFLLQCAALNYIILILWFLVFTQAHAWMYRLHQRWFHIPVETFDTLNWACMGAYKIGILLLNLVPLLVLCIASW